MLKHTTKDFYAIRLYLKTYLLKNPCKRLPLLKHNFLILYPAQSELTGTRCSRHYQETYMFIHANERLPKMFSPTENKLVCSYTLSN